MKAKSPMSFMKARQKRTLKRTNSCPDWHEIEEIVAAKNKPIIEESKPKGPSMSFYPDFILILS